MTCLSKVRLNTPHVLHTDWIDLIMDIKSQVTFRRDIKKGSVNISVRQTEEKRKTYIQIEVKTDVTKDALYSIAVVYTEFWD